MGVIKYLEGPNNAELTVGGKPLSVTRGQTYELENTLIAKLVASDPGWWEVVEGYTPPPPGEEDADLYTVMHQLGHQSLDTTAKYLRSIAPMEVLEPIAHRPTPMMAVPSVKVAA